MDYQLSPILIKEMRARMRGVRPFLGLTLFQFILAGITLLVYTFVTTLLLGEDIASANIGQVLFGFLGLIELFLLAAIVPALTSGAITSERQKQTFDMLVATPLSPRQVLRGKFFASMNYLFLLIFATLPINSVVFLFGGVGPITLLWWLVLAFSLLSLLGSLGLLMSTLFKSSVAATVVAYLSCFLAFVILPVALMPFLFYLMSTSTAGICATVGLAIFHPFSMLGPMVLEWRPVVPELPVSLTILRFAPPAFYAASAALLFLLAEARLSTLMGYPGKQVLPWIGLFGTIAMVAVAYALTITCRNINDLGLVSF